LIVARAFALLAGLILRFAEIALSSERPRFVFDPRRAVERRLVVVVLRLVFLAGLRRAGEATKGGSASGTSAARAPSA
jgi:hypothetical protein